MMAQILQILEVRFHLLLLLVLEMYKHKLIYRVSAHYKM